MELESSNSNSDDGYDSNEYRERLVSTFIGTGLTHITTRNANNKIYNHWEYNKCASDFERGFYEAMDFMLYITSAFSIASAFEIWPPKSEYDIKYAYEILEDGTKILKNNHFWTKYKEERRDPSKFYRQLDVGNKSKLYMWYKTEMLKREKVRERLEKESNNLSDKENPLK